MGHPPEVRLAALWGHEHPDLGAVATASCGPAVGVALSRGRFPKAYAHLDPNEDAVVAAVCGDRWLLAVADGHSGFDAARAALEQVVDAAPEILGGHSPSPRVALESLMASMANRVRAVLADASDERALSRTAVTVVLGADQEAGVATLGDTAAVRIRRGRGKRVSTPTGFLGATTELPRPGSVRLRPGDRVVVCSDGLVDFLGTGWTHQVARIVGGLPGEQAAADLLAAAFAAGAGDHVAVAVGPQIAPPQR
jgi:PPM family protein phosphatase